MARVKIGRTRIKAAEILNRCFPEWEVRPEDIQPATRRWRTDWRLDVYRWELFTRLRWRAADGQEIPVVLGCWERLTDFVKRAAKEGCHEHEGEIWPGPA